MSKSRQRLLITAGPTHEPIDAVRYLANRSSGAMGLALAKAGRDGGYAVTLLLGPVSASPPEGVAVVPYVSSHDLTSKLDELFTETDVLIMAAAVADYRPRQAAPGKMPRTGDDLTLELEPVPDLVARCAATKRDGQRLIGFALEEPAALEQRAGEKLRRKNLDAIVANPLETMGAAGVDAVLITAAGERLSPGAMTKDAFAKWLIDWLSA